MHSTLEQIKEHLTQIITRIEAVAQSDEPIGIAHNNFGIPCLTRSELIAEAQSIIDLIEDQNVDELGEHETILRDYVRRLEYIQKQTIIQFWGGHAGQAISAYFLTLQGLRNALAPVVSRDKHKDAANKLKRLTQQLHAMEASLNKLEPRTIDLKTMVGRIEQAYNAADQLPTDLASLSEAREKIADLLKEATQHQGDVLRTSEHAEQLDRELQKITEEAKSVLSRCETAYSAATSIGLAAAFNERSIILSKSMWFWIAGLVVALASGSYFGSTQLHSLEELFKNPDIAASIVVLNLLLSLLSIGAPVWFAWLSTKQIGQRFRLAEDYAFKASVSRAYEGFRREAARFDDKNMEAQLLISALTRFDELPLRLVETDSHGSPWHELIASSKIKQAMHAVPGFAEQVKDLASKALESMKPAISRNKRNRKTVNPAGEVTNDTE